MTWKTCDFGASHDPDIEEDYFVVVEREGPRCIPLAIFRDRSEAEVYADADCIILLSRSLGASVWNSHAEPPARTDSVELRSLPGPLSGGEIFNKRLNEAPPKRARYQRHYPDGLPMKCSVLGCQDTPTLHDTVVTMSHSMRRHFCRGHALEHLEITSTHIPATDGRVPPEVVNRLFPEEDQVTTNSPTYEKGSILAAEWKDLLQRARNLPAREFTVGDVLFLLRAPAGVHDEAHQRARWLLDDIERLRSMVSSVESRLAGRRSFQDLNG